MAKVAMAVDLDYCVGCFACESACKLVNQLPDGTSWLKVHPRDIISEEYLGRLVMDRFPIPVNVEMCIFCRERTGCEDDSCNGRNEDICQECSQVKKVDKEPVCASSCVGRALYIDEPEKVYEWAEGRRTAVFTA